MKAIVVALEKNKKLRTLSLGNNNIGYKGAKLLADALENNKNISKIDISNCKIGNKGIKSIVQMLQKNTTIISIEFCGNHFDYEGLNSIISMMEKNYKLLLIEFDDKGEFVGKYMKLLKYLRRNKQLRWRFVYHDIIDICIAMFALELPVYVLLEIVDWFPYWVCKFCDTKIYKLILFI